MKKKLFILLGISAVIFSSNKVSFASEPVKGEVVSLPLDKEKYAPRKYKSIPINEQYNNESIKVKETQGWFWGSETKEYPTKAVIVYEVGVIEAPYVHNAVGYLPLGSTFEYGTTSTSEINYSKEVSISTSGIYKASLSAEGRIHAIKALASFEHDTQLQIAGKIDVSKTSKCETYYKVTIPIKENGYYFDDLRATYNLYLVEEFSITNTRKEVSRKQSGLAVDVFYDVIQTCVCTNVSYLCQFKTSCGRCLVKYKQNSDGTFSYDGPISNEEIMYI